MDTASDVERKRAPNLDAFHGQVQFQWPGGKDDEFPSCRPNG